MDYTEIKKEITEYLERNASQKRLTHTEGVRKVAMELAKLYGADEKKAELASLFHDMYRGVKDNNLNYYINNLGLDEKYLGNANLAHGKIAAKVMQRDFDVLDEDILNAVSYHTTGRANMSTLEKIVFIADAIEPNRMYPGVDELRKLAYEDLDEACLKSMQSTINYVLEQGKYLDEDTLSACDYFMKRKEN